MTPVSVSYLVVQMRCSGAARFFVFLLAAPCARAVAQKVYVGPSSQTIYTETERHEKPPEARIYVVNRSTVPITIIATRLEGCRNLRQPCAEQRASVKVRPNGRAQVIRLRPSREDEAWSYRFGFTWRPDSSPARVVAGMLAGTDPGASEPLIVKDGVPVARPKAQTSRLALGPAEFAELAERVFALRAEPESIIVAPGEQLDWFERTSILVLDDKGEILGSTRMVEWATASPMLERTGPGRVVAHRIGRSALRFRLRADVLGLLPRSPPEVKIPVIVAVYVEPNAPVFVGRALDADTRRPLACARVALEDSTGAIVGLGRALPSGDFRLPAPKPGTYRVRAETWGWAPAYGPEQSAGTGEEKRLEMPVRFAREQLTDPRLENGDPARVLEIRTSVNPTGRTLRPVLGIVARSMAANGWIHFAVDSAGTVDTTTLMVPKELAPARARILSDVRRMRWAPATEQGTPTCDLVRMRVDITKP